MNQNDYNKVYEFADKVDHVAEVVAEAGVRVSAFLAQWAANARTEADNRLLNVNANPFGSQFTPEEIARRVQEAMNRLRDQGQGQ